MTGIYWDNIVYSGNLSHEYMLKKFVLAVLIPGFVLCMEFLFHYLLDAHLWLLVRRWLQ